MSKTRTNILFMLHRTPPVHGSSLMGKLMKESNIINNSFEGRYIYFKSFKYLHNGIKINIEDLIKLTVIWFHLLGKFIHRKPNLCYYALTTTGNGFRKDVLLVALLRLFRVKIVYHLHNKGVLIAKKKKVNDLLYRFVFKNSSAIILSQHLYFDIESNIPKSKVYNCPNGIKDYQPETSLLKLPSNDSFKILFLSNIIKDKGVFVLIEACSILKNKGYNFQCDFVGGEGDVTAKQLMELVIEKGLTQHVKYLGKRYGKLKDMAFEQADVFVLPSRYDCFPLVVLEAMQHSLPVITAREAGMQDMIDDCKTGFLIFPYDDANALAEKIEYFIVNPSQRKEMGVNGRIKYEEHYTLPIFEQRLHNILSELIHN